MNEQTIHKNTAPNVTKIKKKTAVYNKELLAPEKIHTTQNIYTTTYSTKESEST